MTNAALQAYSVGVVASCSGSVCGGLYGTGSCLCVQVTHHPQKALSIEVVIEELVETPGMMVQPFISHSITEKLVGAQTLEVLTLWYSSF